MEVLATADVPPFGSWLFTTALPGPRSGSVDVDGEVGSACDSTRLLISLSCQVRNRGRRLGGRCGRDRVLGLLAREVERGPEPSVATTAPIKVERLVGSSTRKDAAAKTRTAPATAIAIQLRMTDGLNRSPACLPEVTARATTTTTPTARNRTRRRTANPRDTCPSRTTGPVGLGVGAGVVLPAGFVPPTPVAAVPDGLAVPIATARNVNAGSMIHLVPMRAAAYRPVRVSSRTLEQHLLPSNVSCRIRDLWPMQRKLG